jgi:hypothetical protein
VADGITVQWKTRLGANVSLCDGPVRGADRFIGPDTGEASLAFAVQPRPVLRGDAQKISARGNAAENWTLKVTRACSTHGLAFYHEIIWPSTLAPQADLAVTITVDASQTTYFLKSAALLDIARTRKGVAVDFTFKFSGGLWTTS